MQTLWITVWRYLKKLKIESPYDPVTPLLGLYLEKTIILKDTLTPAFIAALFTIARTWKQAKCLLREEWIKKMYTMEYCFCLVAKLYPTLCNFMDCSPPDSSVRVIFQARIPEEVVTSFSRGSSKPRDWTQVSCISRQILYRWTTTEAHIMEYYSTIKKN